MSKVKFLLIAVLLLAFMYVSGFAQEKKPSDQKPAPVTWSDADEPSNEVEQMLADAKKRGEVVLAACVDRCREDPDYKQPEGFERGRVVSLPKPTYPPIARAARAKGTVEVRVLVDVDGKVIAAVAISGHPLLYAASVKAARDSLFTPTKWGGEPVKVTGVIQYNFVEQK